MIDDLIKGKLLTLAAVAAMLVAAWRVEEIAPASGLPMWTAVPLALLVSIYVHQGYRGFRWVAACLLFAAGVAAVYRIVAVRPFPGGAAFAGLAFVAAMTLVMGFVIVRSRAVNSYIVDQRERRSEYTAILLISVWIVLLALASAWLWMLVLAEVL